MHLNRRDLLKTSATWSLAACLDVWPDLFKPRFYIGACDWSIGKSSDPTAFDLAKAIGLQGVQVNLGSEKNNLHLRQKEIQTRYLSASRKTGIKITSLAIGELNNVPYKSDPRTIEWVHDSIAVAKNLGVTVVLLAFFGKNDLRNDDTGKKEVVRRLKEVIPVAEKAGITLGIESYLSAGEHLDIINQVGSRQLKVYYDFRNSADAGYDIFEELKLLGGDIICEIHMKENGFLLGHGTLDWTRIKDTLQEINFTGDGWMQIEGSLPANMDVTTAYKHNYRYLHDTFI